MFALGPRVRHSRQNRQVFHTTAITPACPACGHEVTFDPRIVGLTCPRCRTPLHRQPDDDTPIAATSVVPCVVTSDQATRTLADALKDAPAPGQSPPSVRLVFMPFWRFNAHVRASWHERTWTARPSGTRRRAGAWAATTTRASSPLNPPRATC